MAKGINMREEDEVAGSIRAAGVRKPSNMDEARRIVKRQMPDESVVVQDNVAEAMLRSFDTDFAREFGGGGQ
jgi:hypothetical protein